MQQENIPVLMFSLDSCAASTPPSTVVVEGERAPLYQTPAKKEPSAEMGVESRDSYSPSKSPVKRPRKDQHQPPTKARSASAASMKVRHVHITLSTGDVTRLRANARCHACVTYSQIHLHARGYCWRMSKFGTI